MSEQTLTTLDRNEAELLQNFVWQVDTATAQFGDHANVLKIEYDGESGDFEIATNEPKTKKAGRASRLRVALASWGYTQLERIEGYNRERVVSSMIVSYNNGEYGVSCVIADDSTQTAEPADNHEQAQ